MCSRQVLEQSTNSGVPLLRGRDNADQLLHIMRIIGTPLHKMVQDLCVCGQWPGRTPHGRLRARRSLLWRFSFQRLPFFSPSICSWVVAKKRVQQNTVDSHRNFTLARALPFSWFVLCSDPISLLSPTHGVMSINIVLCVPQSN